MTCTPPVCATVGDASRDEGTANVFCVRYASCTLVRVGTRASKRNGTKTGPHVVTSNVLCTLRVAQQEASR